MGLLTNRNHTLDVFHHDYGKSSDYPEQQALHYAGVEALCTIADILEDILTQLRKWIHNIVTDSSSKIIKE